MYKRQVEDDVRRRQTPPPGLVVDRVEIIDEPVEARRPGADRGVGVARDGPRGRRPRRPAACSRNCGDKRAGFRISAYVGPYRGVGDVCMREPLRALERTETTLSWRIAPEFHVQA